MFINHDKEKLANCVLFFVNNIDNLGYIKLFKLLSFLDCEHARQTGWGVWVQFPCLCEVMTQVNTLDATQIFQADLFTPRELDIMASLAPIPYSGEAPQSVNYEQIPVQEWIFRRQLWSFLSRIAD